MAACDGVSSRKDLQNLPGRRRLAHFGQDPRQRIVAPEIFPAGQELSGRFAAPVLPIDLLPLAQQAADHLAQPGQAVLHDQVDHRFVAGGQALAKLLVDQFIEHGLRGRGIEHLEMRIEPGLDGMRPQERAAERVDRGDAGRVQFADRAEPVIDVFFRGIEQSLACRPLESAGASRGRPVR